jgi:hypothetical protein
MSSIAFVTLGPEGTDAAYLASRLSDRVLLFPTFRSAMESSASGDGAALIPCGAADSSGDLWVDLHFGFRERLVLARSFECATKPMCLAQQIRMTANPGVSSHRATLAFATQLVPHAPVRLAPSKVHAVRQCARGETEFCIGSVDVVEKHDLHRVACFSASMLWTVYCLESQMTDVVTALIRAGVTQ